MSGSFDYLAWPLTPHRVSRGQVGLNLAMQHATLLWKAATAGWVNSPPAVFNGAVFVGSGDGTFYSFDLSSGNVLWAHRCGGPVAFCGCAIYGDRVVFADSNGNVRCACAVTGKLVWEQILGGPIRSSIILDKNRVFIGSLDGCIYCLDADNGSECWTVRTGGEVSVSPAVRDGHIVIGSDDYNVYCLSEDGRERWVYKTEFWVHTSPCIAIDHVFVASWGKMCALELGTGRLLWATQCGAEIYSSPFYYGGGVYFGGGGKEIYALDAATGEVWWRRDVNDSVVATPIVLDDHVLVGGYDNRFYCLSRDTGETNWAFEVGNAIASACAIAGDKLVVGCDDMSVYCIRGGINGPRDWPMFRGSPAGC